jgi:hypothetical protein
MEIKIIIDKDSIDPGDNLDFMNKENLKSLIYKN